MKTRRRLPALSIEHLWPLATLFVIFFFLSTHPVRPHDFWWHLRAGQQIVTTRRIPDVDTFSFTMTGQPYDSYASFWIVESAYYLLYSLGGLPLLIFGHAVVITLAYGLVLGLCRKASGSWRLAAAGTFFAAVLGFNDWNLRPQGIAFLLGALTLWAIYEHRWRPRPWLLVVFPVVMLVWANSHGSFIVGLLLLAIWLVDETWHAIRTCLRDSHASRTQVAEQGTPTAVIASGSVHSATQRQASSEAIPSPGVTEQRCLKADFPTAGLAAPALALATAALACLANPRGLGIIAYVRSLAGNPIIRDLVTEWAPPSFRSTSGALFLGGLLLAATLLAVSPRRPSLFQMLSFLSFAVLGFQGIRFAVWFGMVMAPVVAEHLAATVAQSKVATRWLRRPRPAGPTVVSGASESPTGGGVAGWRRSPKRAYLLLNWILAGMLLLAAVLSTPWLKHILPLPPIRTGLVSTETPVEATRFLLQKRLPGRLFHELGFGSYLIWAAPAYPVFVDPRIELYPLKVWRDYLEISAGSEGWEQKLEEYGVNALMLSPQEQPSLVRSPNWRLTYRDLGAVLFERARNQG
jgi:hypothetical protein